MNNDAAPLPDPARSELRAMDRPLLRIRVSDTARSAVIGYTRDANIEGCFLCTTMSLRVGDLLPISLASEAGEVQGEMEVVRVMADGVGLQIRSMGTDDRRKFRRMVAEANTVVGTRNAAARVLDAERRTTPAITDPARILAILAGAVGARVRLLAADQDRLWEGTLGTPQRDRLTVQLANSPVLGTALLVVLDHKHVNYAFQSNVLAVGGLVELSLPVEVGFAERRSRERRVVEDTTLLVPLPWAAGAYAAFEVVDVGQAGISARAPSDRWLLGPGTALTGARIRDEAGEHTLVGASVVRVALEAEAGEAGQSFVRVGIALGPARRELLPEPRVVRGDWFARLRGWWADRWSLGVSTLASAWRPPSPPRAASTLPPRDERRVTFPNRRGQQVVGLLDLAEADAPDGAETPLVIVVPGFGGRKEQMSQLATTLVDTFRRHHADIAVLRFDGTNNLGESEKDPGNEVDGKHTLNYRLSNVSSDVLGALDWAHRNHRIRAKSIILVSVSFAACAVTHLLSQPEVQRQFPELRLWVSYMGAPDPRDAVLHVSGHHDAAAAISERHRLLTLIGCIVDVHAFWHDAQELGIGTLVEAQRDMANVRADVLWIAGQHDGWMDLARVRRLMEVDAPGARRLLVADTGHVPRTGREAQRQFALITQEVWRHLHGTSIPEWYPGLARLHARERAEWKSARRARPADTTAFWRRYLLADGGLGFDVLAWYPSYREFIDAQADALDVAGCEVLELGAGTGNLTVALAQRSPHRLVAVDLVPEALERIRQKVPLVSVVCADLDGCSSTVMRRFVAGEIRTFSGLRGRVPIAPEILGTLDRAGDPRLYAAAIGRSVDLSGLAARADVGEAAVEAVRVLGGLLAVDEGAVRRGLPFPDASFDKVGMSLVLSYLQFPEDLLFEIRRVLRPGGELVLSSMVRDADTSALFNACVETIGAAEADVIGGEPERERLLNAARHMLDAASELFRLEEEGHFRFYDPDELIEQVSLSGFAVLETWSGFGSPGQAVSLRCRRLP